MKSFFSAIALLGIFATTVPVLAAREVSAKLVEQQSNEQASTYVVSDDHGTLARVFVRKSDGRALAEPLRGTYAGKGLYFFASLDEALDWVSREVR